MTRLWSAVMKKLGSLAGLTTSSFLCHSTWKNVSAVKIHCNWTETVPPSHAVLQWPDMLCIRDTWTGKAARYFCFWCNQTAKKNVTWCDTDVEMELIYLYTILILICLLVLCGKWSFYFVAAGDLCNCWWSVSETNHALCSFCALLQKPKMMSFLFLVYYQIGLLVFLLSLDLISSWVYLRYGSIVVSITASCNAANNWAFFLLCAIPVFSCGDFCSDVLFFWTAVGTFLPISPYTVELWLASLLLLVSGLSEWLA